MARIWIKLYIGWHESDWLTVLSAESRLAWILMIERVKTHGDGGSLKKSNYDDLARRWNVGVEHIRNMVKAAVMDGAIDEDDTHWHVTGWSEYQEDRTNADRQKRYRDRKNRNETESNNGALRNDRNVTGRGEENRGEEKKKEPTVPKKKFIAPTTQECAEYAKLIGMEGSEAKVFFDFYESKGWKVGKNPMVSWHHAMSGWKARNDSKPTMFRKTSPARRSASEADLV